MWQLWNANRVASVSLSVNTGQRFFLRQVSRFSLYAKKSTRWWSCVGRKFNFHLCNMHTSFSFSQGPQWQRSAAHKYVFTFRPKWWVIAVAVCAVAMDVETTVKGAFCIDWRKILNTPIRKGDFAGQPFIICHLHILGQWMLWAESLCWFPETLQPGMHKTRLLIVADLVCLRLEKLQFYMSRRYTLSTLPVTDVWPIGRGPSQSPCAQNHSTVLCSSNVTTGRGGGGVEEGFAFHLTLHLMCKKKSIGDASLMKETFSDQKKRPDWRK